MSEVGDKIRKVRVRNGMTIQTIAKKTKLSPGYISRMERGDVNPSLSSIKKIADVLGISIGHLFEDDNGTEKDLTAGEGSPENTIEVVRKENRRKLVYPGQAAYDYLLTPSIRNVGIEFILTVLEPGGSSGDDFYTHQGEECILVNKGALQLYVGEQHFELKEGDSIHFKSTIPHRYENTSQSTVEAVWATVPPTF